MARFNDRTEVTPAAMRTFAELLRSLADTHETLATAMETAEVPSVDSKNMKTGAEGLVKLARFLGAVVEAYCENLSAVGVGDLAGAVAELERLTKRNHAALAKRIISKDRVEKIARHAAKKAERDSKKAER